MKAIIVSVEYADLLALTLPYNRHHFEQVLIVTTPEDENTLAVAEANGADVFQTRLFYDKGAKFNKWAALEAGLDVLGRDDWICLIDADILWPKEISFRYEPGRLYSPFRRMMTDLSKPIPNESTWGQFWRHRDEFAGYTQIFHADDPVIGQPPWHQINWSHAGGADTFFQHKWPPDKKVRPNWECLHLGDVATNWCGRVTPMISGDTVEQATERSRTLNEYMRRRRTNGNYDHEKIG